jgi:hypothetical protein
MICPLPRANEMSALRAGPSTAMSGKESIHGHGLGAVERMMKLEEVICRPLVGSLSWLQAADILGMDPRSLRRWRARYQAGDRLAL